MSDVVVTVPKALWEEWLDEGDTAYDNGSLVGWPAAWECTLEYGFITGKRIPKIEPGERVYIVAHGKLRGYSPLLKIGAGERFGGAPGSAAMIRRGDAVAVTIDEPIRGFQGFRYRWWDYADEKPFPLWTRP